MWDISVFADEIYEPGAGFEPALALLRKIGVEYTELRVVNGFDHFMNISEAQLDDLQRLLRKYNIKVGALGTPLFKCPVRGAADPRWGGHHRANVGIAEGIDYQYYLKQLPRAFAMADRFRNENIRCFAFWREYALDEVFDEIVEKLARAAEIAWKAGHRLYLENEHNTMAGTGVEQARILKAVNSPGLTGIYDDGNSARIGGNPYPDDYNAMRGLISHVHLKFEKLDVMCGWLSLARPRLERKSGFSPYFIWHQPKLPFTGEIKIGDKLFKITGQRTFLTADHSVADHLRSLLTALKQDGYKGRIAIDNSAFESLDRRVGRADLAELEADVQRTVEALRRMINECLQAPASDRC